MTEAVVEVRMPRLSDSMEEGTITQWLKHDGDTVVRGDELVEVETDKAIVVHTADADGTLQIVLSEGETAAVGELIAHIAASVNGAPRGAATATRIKASPVARRLAEAHGVDLATLPGRPRDGRIMKAHVLAAATTASAVAPAPVPVPAPAAASAAGADRVELTRVQRLIAERMVRAKSEIPEFTVTIDVVADGVLALREQLASQTDARPSLNDFLLKAVGLALREHPRLNAGYDDGTVERHHHINLGFAVATDDALIVPTITDADAKSVATIAAEARDLADRARNGTIRPAELDGATFTVSNLGMYGVTSATAVISEPQAAILAVGAALPRLCPDESGTPVVRRVMQLTLTADHRIVYGAHAAAFLATVRDRFENVALLLWD